MRFDVRALVIGVSLAVSGQIFAVSKDYTVDASKSVIKWKGSKVAGPHNGTLNVKDGAVTLDGAVLKSANFTLDMASIKNLDVEGAEWKKKLEDHLKSNDFFNVAGFPTGSFKLMSATPSKTAGVVDIKGDLTIKGITKPVSFPATIAVTGKTATANATLKINRLEWDIRYNSGKFFDPKQLGDKLIYDDIELGLELVANEVSAKK
jgi:polyisoprenoid-binding protein YceI